MDSCGDGVGELVNLFSEFRRCGHFSSSKKSSD